MRRILFLYLALLSTASALAAEVQRTDTSSFYQDACLLEESDFVKSGGGFKIGQCYGFINGAIDALKSLGEWKNCPPEGSGVERYKNIWLTYLTAHPDKGSLPAVVTLRDSLAKAFPCAK